MRMNIHRLTKLANAFPRKAYIALVALILLLVIIILGVIWVGTGRYLTMLVDQVATIGIASTHIDKVEYDGGGFRIGERSLDFGTLNNQRFELALYSDPSNHVLLCTGGHVFILGARTNPVDSSGRPDIALIPDAHDEVSLTTTRSALSWPTPFEINFMMRTPWWKRYVYYRLVWKKPSGAELTMLWRYEQDYYAGSGWTEPAMMWNFETGLLKVNISSRFSHYRLQVLPIDDNYSLSPLGANCRR